MRHQILRKSIYTTAVALTCLVSLVHAGVASAVTSNDLFSIRSYTPYYDPTATACGGGNDVSAVETGTGNATLNLTGAQVAIAKVIIGIAKTDNVGQAGALIGLMVALTESELKIYANSNVPLSMNNPNKQAVGSNYDSLGVYQQRISMGWSTISSSPSNLAAVNQLMDPAYNAEAFFGSPPGSSAPSALSKGLLNVSGWQNMQPWTAAQKVQASGDPSGSNYEVEMPAAQQIIKTYYSGAPAVPLPVSFKAGSGGTSPGSANSDTSACTSLSSLQQCNSSGAANIGDKILCDAKRYTGIWYYYGGAHAGRAAYVAGCPDPTNPPDNHPHGKPAIDGTSGNPSPCAVDCSGLVSMVIDDVTGQSFDAAVAGITGSGQWQRVSSYSKAQPGDIVTITTEHVEIFVSYNSSNGMVTTFGAHQTGTQTGLVTNPGNAFDSIWHYVGPGS